MELLGGIPFCWVCCLLLYSIPLQSLRIGNEVYEVFEEIVPQLSNLYAGADPEIKKGWFEKCARKVRTELS